MYKVLANEAVQFRIKIWYGCRENSKKLYGATFLPHPVVTISYWRRKRLQNMVGGYM